MLTKPGMIAAVLIGGLLLGLTGCGAKQDDQSSKLELIIISPHNEFIKEEFGNAFNQYHVAKFGQEVEITWPDVGGGSTAILRALRNHYERSDTSGMDMTWGGGDYNFVRMANEGFLEPVTLPQEILDAVPATIGGLPVYDPEHRWFGTALSGFGFMYNKTLLQRLKVTPPALWEDLGDDAYHGLIGLADPTQSGTATVINEMIVQSGGDWPDGWKKLMRILSNANRFFDNSGAAADAPVSGVAPVATCIDFYGLTRVKEAPDELVYVSPEGQTQFTPDPIAILKNPPHRELAERFLEFVLSRDAQCLWALKPGTMQGPKENALGRPPVRPDVYETYGDDVFPWLGNPFTTKQKLQVDQEMLKHRYSVLQKLVRAAAIDNLDGLKRARERLIEKPDPAMEAKLYRLPDNVNTREKILQVAEQLADEKQSEIIMTGWVNFFRDNYKALAQ